jgi:predicted transcriptional regulator
MSKREREIMDVIYRLRRASAAEVHAEVPAAPTYTTVRGLLRILEQKGHLRHTQEGQRYVYFPSTPRKDAGTSLLSHIVRTFFDGSAAKAMAALLGAGGAGDDAELTRLQRIIKQARDRRR